MPLFTVNADFSRLISVLERLVEVLERQYPKIVYDGTLISTDADITFYPDTYIVQQDEPNYARYAPRDSR